MLVLMQLLYTCYILLSSFICYKHAYFLGYFMVSLYLVSAGNWESGSRYKAPATATLAKVAVGVTNISSIPWVRLATSRCLAYPELLVSSGEKRIAPPCGDTKNPHGAPVNRHRLTLLLPARTSRWRQWPWATAWSALVQSPNVRRIYQIQVLINQGKHGLPVIL